MAGSSSNAAAPSLAHPEGEQTIRISSINIGATAPTYAEITSEKKRKRNKSTHGLNAKIVKGILADIDRSNANTDVICVQEINETWLELIHTHLGSSWMSRWSELQCTAVFINGSRLEFTDPSPSAGSTTRIFPKAPIDSRKKAWRSFTQYSLRKRDDPNAPILNLYHTHTVHGSHYGDDKDCRIGGDNAGRLKFKQECLSAVVEKMVLDRSEANDNNQIYVATADWNLTRSQFAQAADGCVNGNAAQICGAQNRDMSILVGSNATMEQVGAIPVPSDPQHDVRVYEITHSAPGPCPPPQLTSQAQPFELPVSKFKTALSV